MKSLEELEAAFDRGLSAWGNEIISSHAGKMGLKVVKLVKKETPVDTGNLRRRWRARLDKGSGKFLIWIENDAEYAAAVNNGHRVVRAKKTVGFAKGRYMLEKGIQEYKARQMGKDVEEMFQDLRKALK